MEIEERAVVPPELSKVGKDEEKKRTEISLVTCIAALNSQKS